MKSLFYTKPGLLLQDVPEPEILLDDEVKIRVAYCGICGSDAHVYAGHLDSIFKNPKKPLPFPLGHEASGVVVGLGKKATNKGLKIGDKVSYYYDHLCGRCYYCANGMEHFCSNVEPRKSAMSEYIVVHEEQVYKLADGVDLLHGALAEPVSVCVHVIDMAEIKMGHRVAISGGGAIGMILTQMAHRAGASKLTVIEPVASKRQQAIEMGATYVIDPINEDVLARANEITGGMGYDVVIEASGAKSTIQPAFDMVAKSGTVVYAALYGSEHVHEFNLWDGYVKEARLQFSFQSPYVWPRTMEVLPELDLESMVQNVYPIDQYQEAFDMQASGRCQKVILDLGGDPDRQEEGK